jgi:hypothetical protein
VPERLGLSPTTPQAAHLHDCLDPLTEKMAPAIGFSASRSALMTACLVIAQQSDESLVRLACGGNDYSFVP